MIFSIDIDTELYIESYIELYIESTDVKHIDIEP
jgi:hypothetical protein